MLFLVQRASIKNMFISQKCLSKFEKCASYNHFDYRVSFSNVRKKIEDESYIEKHSFKPFIKFIAYQQKYNIKKKRHKKTRVLNYASHYDKCIYQYYSLLVNNKYDDYVEKNGINEIAIAYRQNLRKTNIHFAKKAFSFIKENPESIVFVGDFTDFFDNLDHEYLKVQLCKVFNIEKLPKHLYNVYKSITKYSYVEQDELKKTMLNEGIVEGKKIIIPMNLLRKFKGIIHKNDHSCGVPQGISLSAILSNVYMIEFDKNCLNLAGRYNGIYLRYCDDFIFVFPNQKIVNVYYLYQKIISIQ